MAELPGGTVTFVLTDVEGSTALWEEAPETMRTALARHDALFEVAVAQHRGVHIRPRGEGDSRFAVFPSAPDAVAATLAIQEAFVAEAWPTPRPIKVRIGVHTGEAQLREGDYYGSAVNRCARLRGIGHGGQVLLSEATTALVRDNLPPGAALLDLGTHRLKDLTRPEHVSQLVAPHLPTEFPALVSLDARPHNLPLQTTPLLGREQEVQAVSRLLLPDGVRLVTLTGPGGTGKTRLSQQVAADLLDQFEDGAFFVELAPISDPALVASTIAQALDVRETVGRSLLDALVEYLGDRRLLLVLDNFEQVLAAATTVDTLLRACPRLSVLVSSRAALQIGGEYEYPVPPLALPEPGRPLDVEALSQYGAVQLFIERATAINPDFTMTNANAPAVAEICARLDGLPLAIELAAARIRLLAPEAMLPRLGHGLDLLSGGRRDVPARQQTLRGAIAWSYDLLPETEQQLFRQLSVFVGGFTLDAAESVIDAGTSLDTLNGISSLVEHSLVQSDELLHGEPRFRMLETIREYGLEQLRASGEEVVVRRRHLAWCADLAERGQPGVFGPDGAAWLDRFVAELDNVRAALTWSLSDPPASTEAGLRLAGAIQQLWFYRDHLTEGQRWLEQTLAADLAHGATGRGPNAGGSDVVLPPLRSGAFGRHPRVVALNGLAILVREAGHWEQVGRWAEEALEVARAAGDRPGAAHAQMTLANVFRLAGGAGERVIPLYEECLAEFRGLADLFGTWRAHNLLGTALNQIGEYARASQAFDESLVVARRLGDGWGIAQSLSMLGRMAYREGDLDRAASLLDESADRWGQVRATRGRHRSLCELGLVVLAAGDIGRAAACFGESLALCREIGDRVPVVSCLAGLAAAATSTDDSAIWAIQAARLLGSAAALVEALGDIVLTRHGPVVERETATAREVAEAAACARLGDARFAAALAEGRSLPPDRAIDHGLDVANALLDIVSAAAPSKSGLT